MNRNNKKKKKEQLSVLPNITPLVIHYTDLSEYENLMALSKRISVSITSEEQKKRKAKEEHEKLTDKQMPKCCALESYVKDITRYC